MISLFESIYPDKRPVSPSEIQFMLRLFQQDLKTVFLEISYSVEDKIVLLIHAGKVSCVYIIKGDQSMRYPLSELSVLFQDRVGGILRICEISPSSFGAVRTILEQNQNLNSLPLATSLLSDTIRKWQTASEPSFVHIHWPNADGFVFIPGNNFPARQYAFLAEDKISDSAAAVSMFSHWSEPECMVSRYTNNNDLSIWRENNLQLGFSLLLEHSLRRYNDLAGHSLSIRLEDALNRFCRSRVWNITLGGASVDDVHIFDTFDNAAAAYRTIFDFASHQISQVIGLRLFNETVDAGLASLSEPLSRAVLKPLLSPTFSAHR